MQIALSPTSQAQAGQRIKVRDGRGWTNISIDGKHAYSSTGAVIDVASKKIVAISSESG